MKAFENPEVSSKEYEIVFWDNSEACINEKYVTEAISRLTRLGIVTNYINTPENLALSKLYNKIIESYQFEKNYLFVLDQDSEFDDGYFLEFEKIIKSNNPDVILPIVKFKDQIVSPTRIIYLKGFYYNRAPRGFVNSKMVSAINSGMIISLQFIMKHGYRYNEQLRNYCTDDDIMQFVRKIKGSIYAMDYMFEHDL
ncbi:glycosyltransferase, partial [Serratia marcescens]|uniref:glycosyltransferase n=1 Tax=Serratia marcescens TaxID=615 RepID=UPI0021CCC799